MNRLSLRIDRRQPRQKRTVVKIIAPAPVDPQHVIQRWCSGSAPHSPTPSDDHVVVPILADAVFAMTINPPPPAPPVAAQGFRTAGAGRRH